MQFTLTDAYNGNHTALRIAGDTAPHRTALAARGFAWVDRRALTGDDAESVAGAGTAYWIRSFHVPVTHPACDALHPGYWTEELLALLDVALAELRAAGVPIDEDFAAVYADGLRGFHAHLMNVRHEDRYGRTPGLTRDANRERILRTVGHLGDETVQRLLAQDEVRYTAAPALWT